MRTVPSDEVNQRLQVADNGPAKAAYAWQHVSHYQGVGGDADKIYQKNLDVEAAKAKLSRYDSIYGKELGPVKLQREDQHAYVLSQFQPMPRPKWGCTEKDRPRPSGVVPRPLVP